MSCPLTLPWMEPYMYCIYFLHNSRSGQFIMHSCLLVEQVGGCRGEVQGGCRGLWGAERQEEAWRVRQVWRGGTRRSVGYKWFKLTGYCLVLRSWQVSELKLAICLLRRSLESLGRSGWVGHFPNEEGHACQKETKLASQCAPRKYWQVKIHYTRYEIMQYTSAFYPLTGAFSVV